MPRTLWILCTAAMCMGCDGQVPEIRGKVIDQIASPDGRHVLMIFENDADPLSSTSFYVAVIGKSTHWRAVPVFHGYRCVETVRKANVAAAWKSSKEITIFESCGNTFYFAAALGDLRITRSR